MRQKHFDDADDLIYWFKDYLDEICQKQNKSANLAGFARHVFCTKQTLLNYKVDNHPFFDAMQMIMTFLEDETINDGKLGDSFKKFYMVNTFTDYKDTQRVEAKNINVNQDITALTPEERMQRIKELEDKLSGREDV